MDNLESKNSSDQDLPGDAHSTGSAMPVRDVLEGDVFQPGEQYHDTSEQGEPQRRAENEAQDGGAAGQNENVESGLAQYVFVREEREREVRLLFRDASPSDIARTFRSAGAHLITISAERASNQGSPIVSPSPDEVEPDEGDRAVETTDEDADIFAERARKRKSSKSKALRKNPTGEVLMRYFYSLGEMVYTVSIVSPTGVTTSVAATYPLAARSERDLSERLAVVFV